MTSVGSTAALFRDLALALPGTTEAPHFDRRAFRVRTTYATLPPDGATANLRLTPDDQAHWCGLLPAALAPVPNKWGQQGWTTVTLAVIAPDDLAAVLRRAWQIGGGGAAPKPARTKRARSEKG
ncbi:MmcQ/YjbR family DNA-binding protein [uncultured Alsobacter sp.]|uniref:MmcQ/YjbR family DNA-binding protein n=1 Tax=uncultured Alsobacter sp. TaxID=1748258 RepID=UPI0025E6594E|nr:MmcQ/YjbR family DNA-binding protein [uncultured Alsobacter sp.]